METIKIGNQEFKMQSDAYLPEQYAEVSGNKRDLYKDLDYLTKLNDETTIAEFGEFMEIAYLLAYAMILEYDEKYPLSIKQWKKSLTNIEDGEWIKGVLQLAMSTFPRKLQTKD